MTTLRGRTLFITGGSRGIGEAIGLRAARDGANIVIAAKTTEPHPRLPGTIFTAAEAMEEAGGRALAVETDIRFTDQVEAAVAEAVATFGGIDILVNNASAIQLTRTLDTDIKRFDLMHDVNVRGMFVCCRTVLPHLLEAENPHILTLAPPPTLDASWYAPHLAYTLSKVGMSLSVLGLAAEFRSEGVAVNALWPRTTIATAAIRNIVGGEEMMRRSRHPEIVADAAHAVLVRDARRRTGNFFIDEDVLRGEGVEDFSAYAVDPEQELQGDLFLSRNGRP